MKISRENYEKAISLLDEIILKSKQDDLEFKKDAIARHKASESVGESWMVFHTKVLKDFLSTNVHD
jgi:hypothetical protein